MTGIEFLKSKNYKKIGLKSNFQNGFSLCTRYGNVKSFYDAGIRQLVLPVESGSEKVLKQMKKPLKMRISQKSCSGL